MEILNLTTRYSKVNSMNFEVLIKFVTNIESLTNAPHHRFTNTTIFFSIAKTTINTSAASAIVQIHRKMINIVKLDDGVAKINT